MNTPRILVAGLIGLAVIRTAQVFDRLPARMISHFGISGRPDGFITRADFLIIYAVSSIGTILLLMAIPKVSRAAPQLISVPNRSYWLQPEHQPRLLEKLERYCAWWALQITAFWVVVLEFLLRVNLMERPPTLMPLYVMLAAFVVSGLVLLYGATRTFRIPRRP